MYIVSNSNGDWIEADYVMRGRQFPVLHIHTHKCDPVTAYQIFGNPETNAEITSVEKVFVPTEDKKIQNGKTYYEHDGSDYLVSTDKKKKADKTYYEMQDGETTVYRGFTEVDSVGKSPFMPEYGEILIWLTRPLTDYN